MERIITDKDGNKTAVAVPTQRQKTFDELQKDINKSNDTIKKYPPPKEKKKKIEDTSVQSGITDKSFKKGGITGNVFKKSF